MLGSYDCLVKSSGLIFSHSSLNILLWYEWNECWLHRAKKISYLDDTLPNKFCLSPDNFLQIWTKKKFIPLTLHNIKWGFFWYQNFILNVHNSPNIFATNLSQYRKKLQTYCTSTIQFDTTVKPPLSRPLRYGHLLQPGSLQELFC